MHAVTSDLGMTRDRFQFIWRYFHVQDFDKDELDDDGENDDEEEDRGLVEQTMERVQHEQEKDGSGNELDNDDDFKKVV